MHLWALAGQAAGTAANLVGQAEASGGLVINVFWILVVAANFVFFLVAAWYFGLRNIPRNLAARRARIEQSLRDAGAAWSASRRLPNGWQFSLLRARKPRRS